MVDGLLGREDEEGDVTDPWMGDVNGMALRCVDLIHIPHDARTTIYSAEMQRRELGKIRLEQHSA